MCALGVRQALGRRCAGPLDLLFFLGGRKRVHLFFFFFVFVFHWTAMHPVPLPRVFFFFFFFLEKAYMSIDANHVSNPKDR